MKNKFRLNVIVRYIAGVNANQYRPNIISILRQFAWLHTLEYAVSECNPVPYTLERDGEFQAAGIYDMFYFRSTDETQIEAKDLRMIIAGTFDKSFFWESGVEVYYQVHKLLRQFPFPKDYYRQLNYPYIEVYKDGNSEPKICILANEYYNFLGECEQVNPDSN